ncbi:hypothetical protein Aduo_015478 [Ancylostoma duodenale]
MAQCFQVAAVTMNKLRNRDLLDRALSKNEQHSSPDIREQQFKDDSAPDGRELFYCTIHNIPSSMRSKDLREYFSDYVENGKFHCFHYRHRPEHQQESTNVGQKASATSSGKDRSTSCCVISFTSSTVRSQFIQDFHGRHWVNSEGMEIPRRCSVSAVKVAKSTEGSSDSVTDADLRQMIELRPPLVMPQGNVGTPTQYFLDQIKLCRLPASLIPKLGLKTLRRRRKYDSVPFQYYAREEEDDSRTEAGIYSSYNGLAYLNYPTDKTLLTDFGPDNDAGSDNDDDQCEEWERHEALHDDVTEQDRTKPRKYEEEMEIVWEKGGPGLVWYTDKNYWDEREKGTDSDWAWADDWDVDYSVYYEGKAVGSKDARDAVEMREDDERRAGKLVESVFTKRAKPINHERKRRNSGSDVIDIEQYTNRIGSKLLGRMGWKPGSGLGRSQQGRPHPVAVQLEEDGQTGFEKKGFGYHGEKMQRTGFMKAPKLHAIASSFDVVTDKRVTPYKRVGNDATGEILFRRAETTKMKYRADGGSAPK